MKKVYMEHRGNTAGVENNKFYEIIDDDQRVIARWGAIGTPGTSSCICESANEDDRIEAFDEKMQAKVAKGYNVIEEGGVVVESRPSSAGRKWGLEIETHSDIPVEEIVAKMRERGLEVRVRTAQYFKSDGRTWDVKADASCGLEFASPICSGEAGMFDAKIAVEKIRELCPDAVTSKCGLHVTVDVDDHSNEDLKRLIIGYLRAQEHFYSQCNESRQSNRYCERNPDSALPKMLKASLSDVISMAGGNNRYHGLNLTRLRERGVVEFRMMESSVAIRKVGTWIRSCVSFVDGMKASGISFKSTDPMKPETFEKILAGTWRGNVRRPVRPRIARPAPQLQEEEPEEN